MKVKVFYGFSQANDFTELEEEVNKWLEDNPCIETIERAVTPLDHFRNALDQPTTSLAIIIFYEER